MSNCERFYFPSSSGADTICAARWDIPQPRAIVQLCHGMSEYIMRYDAFAQHLNENGYMVCGHDHLGHGLSANAGKLGYFAPDNGWDCLVRDVHLLRRQMHQEFPNTPYVLFGHSMGSFVARDYVARFGKGLQAAIFCGTSGGNPVAGLSRRVALLLKPEKSGDIFNRLISASYNNHFKDSGYTFAWLASDDEVVDKYEQDPLCGFTFTNRGYSDLFLGLQRVSSARWAKSMPKMLPMLLISGADDPVGGYGKGVEKVYDRLAAAGCDRIAIKLYKGMRHEILNEKDSARVFMQISKWLDDVIISTPSGEAQQVGK